MLVPVWGQAAVTDLPTSEPLPLLERFKYLIFLVIGLAILVGVGVLLWQRPAPTTIQVIPPGPTLTPSITPIPSLTPTPGPYTVYITGAVASPEAVVTLPYGSRVLHALDAVGGALPNANLERVNLAQRVEDGDQVHVPTREPGDEDSAAPEGERVRVITATPGQLTVYVTGAVAQPQTMITLVRGSRVQDAIDAAGGATVDADLMRINLGQVLNDGDQVHVPSLDGPDIQTATPNRPPLVHINAAGVDELSTLPGIGPSLAQAIIDYRDANGPFASLENLDNVPGIGPAKLDDIRDRVVFD